MLCTLQTFEYIVGEKIPIKMQHTAAWLAAGSSVYV